jgi:hypothetical protein
VVGLVPNGKTCDDGNKCTVKDMCIKGVCVGTPKCPPSKNPCKRTTCNPVTGAKALVPVCAAWGTLLLGQNVTLIEGSMVCLQALQVGLSPVVIR